MFHLRMRKTTALVRNYYILPCCLLLLNLANSLIGYKAELIADPYARTAAVIFLVICGASIVTIVLAPAMTHAVKGLHRSSRRGGGRLGEILFLIILGVGVAWCYFQLTNHGPAALLPADWRNGR
jgi:hypothetical protein